MKKSERKLLGETLDKALQPPARRKPALATHLAEYDSDEKLKTDLTPPKGESPHLTPRDPSIPISPNKNFNKRANSLDQLALPAGIFPGSSKKLYDALYLRTRGAITPKRNVRATKRELSDWSGIRNVKTIDAHLRYFSAVGLVISEWERGHNEGSLYEVLLPEETSGLFVARTRGVAPPKGESPHLTPPKGESPQILGSPPPQNLGSPHLTKTPDFSTTYSDAKTSFKTTTNTDDESFAIFKMKFEKLTEELTGKPRTNGDQERWGEVADTLIEELRQAATHTEAVSNVPAFLNAHLRRRLARTNNDKPTLVKKDEVGKGINGKQPAMTEAEKAEVIQMIIEMITTGGYSIEQAEAQFGAGLQPTDWQQIRAKVGDQQKE